jgi:hypothetical protein
MVELWGYVLPVNVTLELVRLERWWFVNTLQMDGNKNAEEYLHPYTGYRTCQ